MRTLQALAVTVTMVGFLAFGEARAHTQSECLPHLEEVNRQMELYSDQLGRLSDISHAVGGELTAAGLSGDEHTAALGLIDFHQRRLPAFLGVVDATVKRSRTMAEAFVTALLCADREEQKAEITSPLDLKWIETVTADLPASQATESEKLRGTP